MNWGHLTRVLLASPWLEPSDDLSTPEGMVAASIAILDRMANGERLREVSWRPVRMQSSVHAAVPVLAAPKPSGDGGAVIPVPRQAPRAPSPAPAYASPIDAFAL